MITDLDDTLWAGILGDVGVDGVAGTWIGTRRSTGFSSRRCKVLRILGCWWVWPVRTIRIWFNGLRTLGYPFAGGLSISNRGTLAAKVGIRRGHSEDLEYSADSVLFIDDSSLELAEVRNTHPNLHCRQFEADPNKVANLVYKLADLFGKPFDSEEDALRSKSVRTFARSVAGSNGVSSLEQVLGDANGVLTITPVTYPPDARALELETRQISST